MKEFFSNKKNIFLSIVLLLCISALVFVLFFLDFDTKVKAIDFSGLKEDEIVAWLKSNEIEQYEIKYQYSDSISEGKVIYQSVKEGEDIEKIEIIISKGQMEKVVIEEFDLPEITDTTTREDLEKFFTENGFTDVTYEYVESELDKDIVIKLNVEGKVKKDDLILVTLSAGKDSSVIKIKVPDFTTYKLAEAEAWAKSNSINLKLTYALSEKYERGSIMSQSINKDEEVVPGTTITLGISDGKGVKIPDFTGKTKKDVEDWVKENKLEDVKYVTENSDTVEKDGIISIKPKKDVEISVDYPVIVTVSLGKKIVVTVKTGYEGKTVDEFKKYISSLNETLTVKDSGLAYYSTTYSKGTVYSYDLGNFNEKAEIKYNLSLGKYEPKASEYEGLSAIKAKELANSYVDKKATVSLKLNEVETTDSTKIDKTYGCSVEATNVTCSVGVKKVNQIDANTYNGKTISEAKNMMDDYKKSNFNEGSITLSYGDSGANVDTTYGCTVSGKNTVVCKVYRAVINAESYNGITKENANNLMSQYKNKYGVGSISITDVASDENAGKTFGCVLSGNTVSCDFGIAIQKGTIMTPNGYINECVRSSYEATKAEFERVFSNFTNFKVTPVTTNISDDNGMLCHIVVGTGSGQVIDPTSKMEVPLDTYVEVQVYQYSN